MTDGAFTDRGENSLNRVDFLRARLVSTFTPPREKSSPLFSWGCAVSPTQPRTRPRYSEIEKELLARREAAVSGRRPVPNHGPSLQGGNLKPGHAVQRSSQAATVACILLLERRQEPVPRSPGAIAGNYVLSGLLSFRQPASRKGKQLEKATQPDPPNPRLSRGLHPRRLPLMPVRPRLKLLAEG